MTYPHRHAFDWTLAIARNRAALLRIVAALCIMAGLDGGGADQLPRRVWRRIVRLLRPAEAAARRLLVIAARGIEVAPPKPRPEKAPAAIERLQAAGLLVFHDVNLGLANAPRAEAAPEKPAPAIPAFPLADPPRRFDARAWDGLRPFPADGFVPADPDADVGARHLCRRLLSLKAALDDLDTHAKRLARRMARAGPASAPLQGTARRRVLRRGRPPGHRGRPVHAVDDILRECHVLARCALQPPDTS
ncbi:MAG: hypothetical protein Kow0026_16440 [Oricola sp.]